MGRACAKYDVTIAGEEARQVIYIILMVMQGNVEPMHHQLSCNTFKQLFHKIFISSVFKMSRARSQMDLLKLRDHPPFSAFSQEHRGCTRGEGVTQLLL